MTELDQITGTLYEDKVNGIISTDTFTALLSNNQNEQSSKTERYNALSQWLKNADSKLGDIKVWIKLIRKHLNLKIVSRPVIDELIDHIEIGEKYVINGEKTQEIKIFYKFVGFLG